MKGAAALAVAIGAGCASGGGAPGTFDRLYEAGDWVGAASAFESDSTLHFDERALFRAGLLYAQAGSDVYDPGRARAVLERLTQRYPDSELVGPARVVEGLVGELERSSELVTSLRTRIERLEDGTLPPGAMALFRAGIALADPDASLFDARRSRRNLEQVIRMYPDSEYARSAAVVVDLLAELGRSADAVAALRRQLDQLKEVDLRPTVPPPPPPPPEG
jgi:outer membrane protein assembly factor BamD (BamD/ComL family)